MIRLIVVLLSLLFAQMAHAGDKFITLASTTSTQNSGLFGVILPIFTAKTGIDVHVIAVGTGQALRIGRNGDADVLLVHHRPSENKFVAEGYGIDRLDVMYNDFVIVGPKNDPAKIANSKNVVEAFTKIAKSKSLFASRADDSGTNKKELEIWAQAGITPTGSWYMQTGSGMGANLNLSRIKDSYAMTDRGTWITFGNKGELVRLYSGDPGLFNPYGVILINPARHPQTKVKLARIFEAWLVSDEGQQTIRDFRIDGQQAFCPNAKSATYKIKDKAACPVEAD